MCAFPNTSKPESFLKDNKSVNRGQILPLSISGGRVIRRFARPGVTRLAHRDESEALREIFAAKQHEVSAIRE
jgi:hypothetical protein